MRRPKSTSHSTSLSQEPSQGSRTLPRWYAASTARRLPTRCLVAFASVIVLAGCPGPLRGGDTGTGDTGGATAGTTGGGGTTGTGATSGTTGGAGKGGAGAGTGGSSGPGAGGSATGAAGVGAGTGTGNTSGSAGSGAAGTGTAGATGGSAGGGKGGGGGTTPPRGPTPAMNGINFPFPQNRESSSRCVYPTNYLNADVMAAYAQWKTDLITTNGASPYRRVQRTSTDGVSTYTPSGSTVSEGIGYGMLIVVYMGGKDDQMLFDDL